MQTHSETVEETSIYYMSLRFTIVVELLGTPLTAHISASADKI